FARSVQTARAVVAEVDAADADKPTPCPDWDAEMMACHIIAILDRVRGAAEARDLMEMPLLHDTTVDRLVVAFDASAQALHESWSDPSLLGREMTLPFGALPGAAVMAVYSSELLVHTWDLAAAIGVEPNWHDTDVAMATAVVTEGIPAEPRGAEMPFDPVVALPADAPPIHHLAAWLGRNPADWT
ncbi:MAG: TIGR03086 family metal-binding protein, partial [Ilumatobacteraceae bacterium]